MIWIAPGSRISGCLLCLKELALDPLLRAKNRIFRNCTVMDTFPTGVRKVALFARVFGKWHFSHGCAEKGPFRTNTLILTFFDVVP